jgi:hypothetical protein
MSRDECLPPTSIEEFGRRHALLYSRLEQEGPSEELNAALEILWGGVGLQIALGPTRAFLNAEDPDRRWPTEFDHRAYSALFADLSDLTPVFANERWGPAEVSASRSVIEGHLCPAVRVHWAKSLEFAWEYRSQEEDISRLLDGMMATVCLVSAALWGRWRVEVVENAASSPLSAWNGK